MDSEMKQTRSKLGWAPEEEKLIEYLVVTQKEGWKFISEVINSKFPTHKRNPKQCRERYNNYIRYEQKENDLREWTKEEEKHLMDFYIMFGSKWTEISNELHNRSPNEIKNKFYGSIRRLARRINEVMREHEPNSSKKPISHQTLQRLLFTQISVVQDTETGISEKDMFIKVLKAKVITLISNPSDNMAFDDACELAQELVKFNIITRADRLREIKNSKKDKSKPQKGKTLSLKKEGQEESGELAESGTASRSREKEASMLDQQFCLLEDFNNSRSLVFNDQLNKMLGIDQFDLQFELIDHI